MHHHSTSIITACTHCISFADCVSHLATKCPQKGKFVCFFICQSKGIQLLFQFLVTSAHQCKHIMAIYTNERHNQHFTSRDKSRHTQTAGPNWLYNVFIFNIMFLHLIYKHCVTGWC